jgi:hypothetical protein
MGGQGKSSWASGLRHRDNAGQPVLFRLILFTGLLDSHLSGPEAALARLRRDDVRIDAIGIETRHEGSLGTGYG